ncbi:hypothetical protein Tsubulata_030463, partial [Turnera subulata]
SPFRAYHSSGAPTKRRRSFFLHFPPIKSKRTITNKHKKKIPNLLNTHTQRKEARQTKNKEMEDLWKRAKLFAEEAAKKSQTLTLTATSSNRIADLVAETAKKSKELALEASKKADQLKTAALQQADQIQQFKSISDFIPPNLSSSLSAAISASSDSSPAGSASAPTESELQKFGITDDLRDFVKGFTSSTFQSFPVQNDAEPEPEASLTTPSNVRKDLTEWQEKHATLVLTTVKQISKLRYELCPRVMKERRFWRIYFTLVSTHREYNEEIKRKAEEQIKAEKVKQSPVAGESSRTEATEKKLESKKSSAEQDLDTFLLGDLEDSDGGEGDGSFDDDDFDKIDNSEYVQNVMGLCRILKMRSIPKVDNADVRVQEIIQLIQERTGSQGGKLKRGMKKRETYMAVAALLSISKSLSSKATFLSLSFRLIPTIPSFPFSSHCSTTTHSLPRQPPPVPKKVPFTVSAHGRTWQDPYHWMRDTNDPDFVDYLGRENSYAQAFMADTQALQRTLAEEMRSRLPTRISTPPERWGPWLYYQYIPEGKEYPVLCRKLASEKTGWLSTVADYVKGQVLYTKVGSGEVDDVAVFTENDSNYCVDITSTKDGKFITVNSNSRNSSEEGIYLVYVVDATRPHDGLQRIRKRTTGVQYFLEHHNGWFYILTNYPLPEYEEWPEGKFYLARCPVEQIQTSNWQNMILPSEDMSFQDMDVFNGYLVLSINLNGLPMLCSVNLSVEIDCKLGQEIKNFDPWVLPLPSNLCSIVPGSNHDFMNSICRVVLSSPVMPDVIVDYDMSKRTFSIVKQEEVKDLSDNHELYSPPCKEYTCEQHGVEDKIKENNNFWGCKDFSDAYCCEKKEVMSHDGVRVPLTILYSKNAWKRGKSPGLLEGYGAYGEVLDKSWCSDRLSLLDRGWVIGFADVRGGGGGDSLWHKSGTGLSKHKSIYDFLACADYLVNEDYVHKDQLGAIGSSAGGLLVGASITIRPELFRVSILKVPFLDICNTMLDSSLPLTILDYEEFGNPCVQSQFESILRQICLEDILVK